jgi:enoyl-CoA hydratase
MAIDYVKDGAIATVRLNRPEKLNAMTLAMYEDLGKAFAEAGRDDGVNVVVLAGAGDRAFCVGADLTESIPALAATASTSRSSARSEASASAPASN